MLGLSPVRQRKQVIKTASIREIDGGLNVIDNDLSMKTRFAKVLDNILRKDDGSLGVRWGTELFADVCSGDAIAETGDWLINIEYFQDHLIAATRQGDIWIIDGQGVKTKVWSTDSPTFDATWLVITAYAIGTIQEDPADNSLWLCDVAHTSGAVDMATDRAANPTWWKDLSTDFWQGSEIVTFAAFKDHLLIANGIDKPVKLNILDTIICHYLVDEGTGSNANTPVAAYVFAMNDFVIFAGDVLVPSTIIMSSTGTSGTFVGDPPPNDSVSIDIAQKISVNRINITGLARYRTQLIVAFDDKLVPVTLGIYDGSSNHVPAIDDAIQAHGSLSHRSMVFLGDDLFMLDNVGVPSIARTVFNETLTPSRPSELIDPLIQKNINQLTVGTAANKTFAVYNLLERQYMLFAPNHEDNPHILGDVAFVIGDMDTNVIVVWSYDHGVEVGDFITIASAQAFNTIIAGDLNGVHEVLTVIDDDYFTIQLPDTIVLNPQGDVNSPSPVTEVVTSNWHETTGYILSHRQEGKKVKAWGRIKGWNWTCGCRSILGTVFFSDGQKIYNYGNSSNPLYQDFINDNVTDIQWAWETPWTTFNQDMISKSFRYINFDTRGKARFLAEMFIDDIYKDALGNLNPTLSSEFTGSEMGGYGAGNQNFGSGRSTRTKRLYAWTTKAVSVKLRLSGTTQNKLRIISILLGYFIGSIRR